MIKRTVSVKIRYAKVGSVMLYAHPQVDKYIWYVNMEVQYKKQCRCHSDFSLVWPISPMQRLD